MLRRILFIPFAILATCVCRSPAQNDPERGVYHHEPDHGFAVWIPAGYVKAAPRSDQFLAYYKGGNQGGYAIEIQKPDKLSVSQFVDAKLREAGRQFPGSEVEVIRDVDAAGRKAVLLLYRKLGGNKAFKDTEMAYGCVPLSDKQTLPILLYTKAGALMRGVGELKWMLNTVRYLANRGLDNYLSGRRVDVSSGLSFRTPMNLKPERPSGKMVLYSGFARDLGVRIVVSRSDAKSLEAALAPGAPGGGEGLKTWTIPHEGGFSLLGTFVTSGTSGSARVAFQVKDLEKLRFVVNASGRAELKETLLRMVEMVAMEARFIDVTAARQTAQAATVALDAALKKHDHEKVQVQVRVLCQHCYLRPVAETLVKVLPKLTSPELQIEVSHALTETEAPELSLPLMKVAKHSKIRTNPKVLAAVLETLGAARSKKAINLLLDHASRGDNQVSAAAVRALGRYAEYRGRVVKRLVKLMSRAESAAERRNFAARDRWDTVRPAYQEALEKLTGERFRTSSDAEIWLKKNRV